MQNGPHDQARWRDCARLFLQDPERLHLEPPTSANSRPTGRTVTIPGMKTPLYLYQLFGVFVMFQMEMFLNGGYLADEMGLGKVCCYLSMSTRIFLTVIKRP